MHTVTRRAVLAGAAVGALAPFAPSVARAEAKKVEPLSDEHRAALDAIPTDPLPENLIQDQHFYTSDEHNPERFRTTMADLGGIFVGVGPEQNYFFAGWMQPDIVVLLDFDQTVVDLHGVYRSFFMASADPEAFIKLWWHKNKDAAKKAMTDAASSDDELARFIEAYNYGHKLIYTRLKSMRLLYESLKIPTYLNDQDQYDFIIAMFKAGRVKAVRGDLTADGAMKGLAKAAKKMGLKVRVQYVSNVEQYFDYDSGMSENLLAQPVDDQSLILRTVYKGDDKYDRYHYLVQTTDAFRAWMEQDKPVKNLRKMMETAGKRIKKTKEIWRLPGPK